jgi:mannose-1-phosphate guanylyltransferase
LSPHLVVQRALREIAHRPGKKRNSSAPHVCSKYNYFLRFPGLTIAQTFSEVFFKTSPETGASTRCGIILAAGEGNRLCSFVKKLRGYALPKQYVNFIGTRSMLEHTFYRAQKMIPAERLFTVVSQSHLRHPEVARQLSSRPMANLVEQPDNRDTGPGLLLPLAHLYKRYPDSAVVVFPADHFILEEDLFMAHVDQAFLVVEQDPAKVVLLGINPSEAEPEYGYIVPGRRLNGPSAPGTYEVSQFIEKPEREVARDLVSCGGLWNTLVMVFKAKTFLNAVSRIAPLLYGSFERIWRAVGTPSLGHLVTEVYQQMYPVNLSKGLLELLPLERPPALCVLPVRGIHWSDWGSEQRIIRVLESAGYAGRLNGVCEKPCCGLKRDSCTHGAA